jgi:2-hydroxychromene-2-carboxylate isomerase
MAVRVEFFFDLSSPWTWLAFRNIQPIIDETSAAVSWRPFLVGGVFNAVNQSIYTARAEPQLPKNRHLMTWLGEWSNLAGVQLNFPSPLHPLKSVNAMRFCCALESNQESLFRFASAAFPAYFTDQRNLNDPAVLIAIANESNLPGEIIAARASSDDTKTRLQSNTNEAIERGAFGSPMIYVEREFVYFGNDQIPIIRQRIHACQAHLAARVPTIG